MNRFTYTVVSLATWGMLSACSQPQAINQAPTSEQEASSRMLIHGSKADTAAVLAASETYRVLSAKHHYYEISGLNYSEIKAIAPSVSAVHNAYIKPQNSKPTLNKYSAFQTHGEANMATQTIKFDENPEAPTEQPQAPQRELPPALTGCDLQATAQPTPALSVLGDALQTSRTMELGQTVTFSAEGSEAIDATQGHVIVQWDVIVPGGSKIQTGLRVGETFELKPDMVGRYQLIMVVRDPSNACSLIQGLFFVTHNPDFNFPAEGEQRPMIEDLSVFSHLARVEAPQAWEKATGKGVVVAVLDSGLHYNHPAIRYNLAINEDENQGSADSDDDQNTFDDDILGWDFVNNDNKPFDDEGHGSHVGGLSSSHIYGVAKDSSILPVKVMNAGGGGDVGTVVAGILYATDNGADVINASLGGFQQQIPMFVEALEYAHSKGVVFVAASGNSELDLSLPGNEIYPGEIDVPNVINVMALGVGINLASYSNFGKNETDVAAPGGDQAEPLYSMATINPHDAQFIGLVGTSMASPVVAGVAALVKEAYPEVTPEEMKQILMTSGESHDELTELVGSGKVLSALEAVEQGQALANDSVLLHGQVGYNTN